MDEDRQDWLTDKLAAIFVIAVLLLLMRFL
jgi:hypothetical protein